MANETCLKCKFFDAKTPNEMVGTCHRYAPSPTAAHYAADHTADWPKVYKHDYCGDFVALTAATTPTARRTYEG